MTKATKLTIGVVLCGNEKYLPYFLDSILHQDYQNFELLLRDQSPEHQTSTYLEKELSQAVRHPNVRLIKGDNRMHSGGHNALINQMTGDVYICASYDMHYPSDFLKKTVKALLAKENQKYGVFCPKIKRWDFEWIDMDGLEKTLSNHIDSCGVGILRSHYCFDIGQTQLDQGQYDKAREVFGPSGALAIFRKSALRKVAFKNKENEDIEYFDELIHYKNDIDLAYRLRWAGERCLFLPNITVHHDRQVSNHQGNMSVILRVIKNRKGKSKWVKENSFWGHLVMMRKNASGVKFSWKTKKAIHIYWLKIFIFMLFLEPFLWKVYFRYRKNLKEINAKKAAITRKVKPHNIEKWFASHL
ncbi:MAG TPA: glycosyltransferase [Candidatus Gracilibacteria bacterium]